MINPTVLLPPNVQHIPYAPVGKHGLYVDQSSGMGFETLFTEQRFNQQQFTKCKYVQACRIKVNDQKKILVTIT